mgnify:CR=1 FL=1
MKPASRLQVVPDPNSLLSCLLTLGALQAFLIPHMGQLAKYLDAPELEEYDPTVVVIEDILHRVVAVAAESGCHAATEPHLRRILKKLEPSMEQIAAFLDLPVLAHSDPSLSIIEDILEAVARRALVAAP